jgi:hypothetical protein
MAIGIDLGFVALELSMLVAPADKRLAVARYASSVPSPHRSNEIPCSVRCSPGWLARIRARVILVNDRAILSSHGQYEISSSLDVRTEFFPM